VDSIYTHLDIRAREACEKALGHSDGALVMPDEPLDDCDGTRKRIVVDCRRISVRERFLPTLDDEEVNAIPLFIAAASHFFLRTKPTASRPLDR
jgi:hypothetical protein